MCIKVFGEYVSIHTPTWGVTSSSVILDANVVFQSTHLHEVWRLAYTYAFKFSRFNPHTYMRCDEDKGVKWVKGFVSIHTPTWGVTLHGVKQTLRGKVSIHTPTWGVTKKEKPKHQKQQFQSTHLHEVWHSFKTLCKLFDCFNPHTYMRCDDTSTTEDMSMKVSIHTPTWGVTRTNSFDCKNQ